MSHPRHGFFSRRFVLLAALALLIGTAPPRTATAQYVAGAESDPAPGTTPESPLGDPTLPESPTKDRRSESTRTTRFSDARVTVTTQSQVPVESATWFQRMFGLMRNALAHMRLR